MHTRVKHYALEFEPDLAKFVFAGRERIDLVCERTKTIVMNAAELEIDEVYVISRKKRINAVARISEKDELVTIRLEEEVSGSIAIHMRFRGTLNDRLLGFYRSRYEYRGKTRYLATTQFEAADARRAFPCWDEPVAKATFDITIIAQNPNTAISNMPVKSRTRRGKKTVYRFGRTPVMSTYLVYLGVGEFENISSNSDGVLIRVITTRGKKKLGRFALDLAKKLVSEYGRYFRTKYPLPKLDLIAAPDFAAGAMENWGAITFRENVLLYDERSSSTRTKQHIAEVLSHEIAHQWFGNLVTMVWWNDLWLNESFATYMGTKFVDMLYPEWNLWDQFLAETTVPALGLDALKSSHPIDVDVKSPAEIREIFDAISYNKGGSVLRMLEHYVGKGAFRRGLASYLREFRYGNAKSTDLWNALEKASGKPVRNLMAGWIGQTGFPVIDAKYARKRLDISQRRFFAGRGTSSTLWKIPLKISDFGVMRSTLLEKKSQRFALDHSDSSPHGVPILLNPGKMSFCRINYDDMMLGAIGIGAAADSAAPEPLELCTSSGLSRVDLWAVVDDTFAMCVAGKKKIGAWLDLVQLYGWNTPYLVTFDVINKFAALCRLTRNTDPGRIVQERAREYNSGMHRRLGWVPEEGEPHTDSLLRGRVIAALGELGDDAIKTRSSELFARHVRGNVIHPDLQDAVFSVVAQDGDAHIHKKMLSLYRGAQSQEHRVRYLLALYGFERKDMLARSLGLALTPEVRSQNMYVPAVRASTGPRGRDTLWPWLKRSWPAISRKIGRGNPLFGRMIASISGFADDSIRDDVRRFFRENPVPGTERTMRQTLERMAINSAFKRRIAADLG